MLGIAGDDRKDTVKNLFLQRIVPEIGRIVGEDILAEEQAVEKIVKTKGFDALGQDRNLIPSVINEVVKRQCAEAEGAIGEQRTQILFAKKPLDEALDDLSKTVSWFELRLVSPTKRKPIFTLTQRAITGPDTRTKVVLFGVCVGLWKEDRRTLADKIFLKP